MTTEEGSAEDNKVRVEISSFCPPMPEISEGTHERFKREVKELGWRTARRKVVCRSGESVDGEVEVSGFG